MRPALKSPAELRWNSVLVWLCWAGTIRFARTVECCLPTSGVSGRRIGYCKIMETKSCDIRMYLWDYMRKGAQRKLLGDSEKYEAERQGGAARRRRWSGKVTSNGRARTTEVGASLKFFTWSVSDKRDEKFQTPRSQQVWGPSSSRPRVGDGSQKLK